MIDLYNIRLYEHLQITYVSHIDTTYRITTKIFTSITVFLTDSGII